MPPLLGTLLRGKATPSSGDQGLSVRPLKKLGCVTCASLHLNALLAERNIFAQAVPFGRN